MAEEQRTFAESPFNPVDSLVFSTLAYLNYEASPCLPPSPAGRVLLHDVVMLSDWDALSFGSWILRGCSLRKIWKITRKDRRKNS